MGIDVTSFYFYRWRYKIGYAIIGLFLVGMLVFAGLYAPGGISNNEVNTVIKSANISLGNIDSYAVTNLPFHLLQRASLHLFGVSNFSIKLPSLVLAALSAFGLIILLQRWFKRNVAVLGSSIAVTTGQFLFIAQSGTADILYIFWPVCLLLLATLIARREHPRTLWKTLFFTTVSLSLYTPLSIYALIALAIAVILHPHLRFIIRQLSRVRLMAGFIIGALALIPLLYGIIQSPVTALTILGIPTHLPNLAANMPILWQQYFGFATSSTTLLMTPVFGLGSMLIIAFGIYRLIKTLGSTQSYVILIWLVCLIPIVITSPRFTSVTFLPFVLLLCTGLDRLLVNWYGIFPRNPYARFVGLIPLVVLVGALVFSGLERYSYGYHYDPYTVANFTHDLAIIPKDTTNLVVAPGQLPFYSVVAKYNKNLNVELQPTSSVFTATHEAEGDYPGYTISRIVTSDATNDADRFYIYKKSSQ